MIQEVDDRHMVVDKSSFAEIAGALAVDVDANSVTVKRRRIDGKEETVTLYHPAGVAIVKRR